jgi:predicted permease
MRALARFLTRWRNFAARRRNEARLREEWEQHLSGLAEENIRSGMTSEEALRRARLTMGSIEAVREQYHAEEGLPILEHLLMDARYALRRLRKSPGLTATTILTLGLGIAALTTVATWTNAVVFNPWPQVQDIHSLGFIDATVLANEGYSVHYDQIQFVKQHAHSFRDAALFEFIDLNLNSANDRPEVIHGGLVSTNYFSLLGIKPQYGAFFQPNADDRAFGAHDEVVLSDLLWRSRFAADPNIIGRPISINRHPFTVIGIAPPGFLGIYGGLAETAWVPLSSLRSLSPDAPPDPLERYGLQAIVRLAPGVTHTIAAAELHTIARSFAASQHLENGWTLNLRDTAHFERGFFSGINSQLPVVTAASVLLMVLVCLNVSSLLGQHAARKKREIAIRTALGAAPARIAFQVLIETSFLAFAGAVAGWCASLGLSRMLYHMLPTYSFAISLNLRSDMRMFAFVAAVAITVTFLCALVPVRQSLAVSQQDALHEGGSAVAGAPRKRMGQRIILGAQLGICFIVLVSCGLLTRTAFRMFRLNTGFDRRNTLTATLDASRAGMSEPQAIIFFASLLDRLRQVPEVAAATLCTHLPMGDWGSGNTRFFRVPGYIPAKGEDMEVVTDFEGPDFFHTMGIAVSQGRDFTTSDTDRSPKVAIVNEAMARRYWPKENALGRSIVADGVERQIVGIVPNFVYHNPTDETPRPIMFLPFLQGPSGYGAAILAIRSRTTAAQLTEPLRRAVASLDASMPLEQVRTLEEVTSENYQTFRLPAELLAVYAIASLCVAIMGLYSVMAYSVLERHRELALRIALGSTRKQIFRLVLRGSAGVVLLGFAIGGFGSIAAIHLLRAMLYGTAPFDPVSYCGAAILLISTALAAGLLPARRAASLDPMQILRSE